MMEQQENKLLWADVEIPDGWNIETDGVYLETRRGRDDGPSSAERISGPVWVSARTRDLNCTAWGVEVHWIDHDGNHHFASFPAKRLHEQGPTFIQDLVDRGLDVIPGKENVLKRFLGAFAPKNRLVAAVKSGWFEQDGGSVVFVLPDSTIAESENVPIRYQPESQSLTARVLQVGGTKDSWQKEIAERCAGQPFLIFAICVALAAPLLRWAGLESGGFHFVGPSSRGKTTLLQVAASVWGCGADPGHAPKRAFTRRWNASINGMEGVAEAYSDLLLPLDELGTLVSFNLDKIIYMLSGGQGGTRMTASRRLRELKTWQLMVISSGETGIRQKLEQDSRRPAHAGLLLRLMDIPADEIICGDTIEEAAALADNLKKACGEHFGIAGRAFLKYWVKFKAKNLREDILQLIDDELAKLGLADATREAHRARQRFGLVAAAGVKAAYIGVLPFAPEMIRDAVVTVFDAWQPAALALSDVERAVRSIPEFVLKNPGLFLDRQDPEPRGPVSNITGYTDDELIYFLPEGLDRASDGHSRRDVVRELFDRGYLVRPSPDRYADKVYIAHHKKSVRVYKIRKSILEADNDTRMFDAGKNSGEIGETGEVLRLAELPPQLKDIS